MCPSGVGMAEQGQSTFYPLRTDDRSHVEERVTVGLAAVGQPEYHDPLDRTVSD
jgi:hypothetical protein